MAKQRLQVYVGEEICRSLEKLASQASDKAHTVSVSQVAAELIRIGLRVSREEEADSLLGVRLETALKHTIKAEFVQFRRLLARTMIEAHATRRLLALALEDTTRRPEYVQQLNEASWKSALDGVKRTTAPLEEALRAVSGDQGSL